MHTFPENSYTGIQGRTIVNHYRIILQQILHHIPGVKNTADDILVVLFLSLYIDSQFLYRFYIIRGGGE